MPGDDQIGGAPPSVVNSGSARSILASLADTAWTVAITPSWATPPDSIPRETELASALVNTLRILEPPQARAAIAVSSLLLPKGAGLITELTAFRNGRFDECLTQLFDRLGESCEPSEQQVTISQYLVQAALAVLAVEATRRWRRRSGPRQRRCARRSRLFEINSLL